MEKKRKERLQKIGFNNSVKSQADDGNQFRSYQSLSISNRRIEFLTKSLNKAENQTSTSPVSKRKRLMSAQPTVRQSKQISTIKYDLNLRASEDQRAGNTFTNGRTLLTTASPQSTRYSDRVIDKYLLQYLMNGKSQWRMKFNQKVIKIWNEGMKKKENIIINFK